MTESAALVPFATSDVGNTSARVIAFAHEGRDWIRGSEQCLLDLVAHLDRRRFTPFVLCNTPTLAREARRRGAEVVEVADWGHGPIAPRAVVERIKSALRTNSASLVHATSIVTLPAIVPAARALRVPVVAHLHLSLNRSERLHNLLHQVTTAVGVAEHVVAALRIEGMPREAVRVIPNAVDAERLSVGHALDLRAQLGIAPDAVVATSVGSLIRRKGHDCVIAAVASARAAGLPLHLLICGDGEESAALREWARSRDVADAVHFLGLRADVGAILRDATDVFVTGARDEALPLNVLEAQWAGLPVIASDIPAHHEALVLNETGLLARTDDPEAFAVALAALAGDEPMRRAFGRAGQALVAARFSMASYVGAFEQLYGDLLVRPPAAYGWMRASRWPRVYTRWMFEIGKRQLRLRADPGA